MAVSMRRNPSLVGTLESGLRWISIEAQRPRSVSGGIMSTEVFALKLENVSDEQLSVLPGHVDKAGVKTVSVGWVGERVDPQHFDRRCKTHLFRQEQGTGEKRIRLKGPVYD